MATAVVFEQAFSLETAGRDVLALLNDLLPRLTILLALRREDTEHGARDAAAGAAAGISSPDSSRRSRWDWPRASKAARTSCTRNARSSITCSTWRWSGAELLRPRMLLVNALENQARRRPDMVREYLDKLALLQQQHALPEGAGSSLVEKGVRTVAEKAQAAADGTHVTCTSQCAHAPGFEYIAAMIT